MRRLSIAFALSTLLLATLCSAQQTSPNPPAKAAQPSSALPPGPVLGGMGSSPYIALWATPSFLVNSVISQDTAANYIGIATTTPVAQLDVNGEVNAGSYEIGGSTVLSVGSLADDNLFAGVNAGTDNVAGSGVYNTFVGYGSGQDNTTGIENTFLGRNAGNSNQTGNHNVFVGTGAGPVSVSGDDNTFTGVRSGYNSNGGAENTFYGYQSGYNNQSGDNNTFLGYRAGYNNTTGVSDLYIDAEGPAAGNENDTIRIGDSMHTAAYIQGVYGVSAGGIEVYINSSGQLGTVSSSLRFKEQVRDMGDSTDALMKLRPVTFFYKPEYANGQHTPQYGLIAEEVAKVYPELVAYDKDGQPYTVRYQYIATMLLNEVQKQYHRAEAQAELIKAQQQEIDGLKQQLQTQSASLQERLSRVEAQVRVELAAAK
ncbi:MAG: tail fiber domain-containing protein [Candidatus Korobacteraceae bacterium]|jgi:endosialidase-like protein